MNKYTLSFINKSLEQEYFNKIAFPYYFQIFSSWCKIIIIIALPCSLYTFFTGNQQYLGYCWGLVSSSTSLLILKFKKNSLNVVVAIYNTCFVFVNICFIMVTDRNIGAEGSLNNMMFIFAGNIPTQFKFFIMELKLFLMQKGSQYIAHFILSIGSNFLLNFFVIIFQNFSYSALFFPGKFNSFHGLLFFSMCFLIWMKYKNEKYQRDLFLLQEKEREVNQFVRDVLPSSVFILKYDPIKDQVQKELVNRTAQHEYNIKDESQLTQFLRNTILQMDIQKKQQISTPMGREISKGQSSKTRAQILLPQNGNLDTLERYVYNEFRLMTKKDNKLQQDELISNVTHNIDGIQINSEQKQFDKKINYTQEQQLNNSISIKNKKIKQDLSPQQNYKDESLQISFDTSSRDIFKFQSKFKSENNNTNKTSQKTQSKNNKLKKQIQKVYQQEEKEKYNIQQFDAYIIKNNVKIGVLVKVVFYYLSYPVCSVCIDEGLKQQIVKNGKETQIKESIYLSHFIKISQKFEKVILFQNILLNQSQSLLYFNHLKNIQDFIQLKQNFQLKVNYNTFQLSALLEYIQQMFEPLFVQENIDFSVLICSKLNLEQNQYLSIKKQEQIIDGNQENVNFTTKILIQENVLSNLNNNRLNKQSEVFQNLDDVSENIEIYNEQQRICQILINLLENSLDYLKKQNISPKYVKLLVKIIQGSDNNSNLIEFKVKNNTEQNYSKQHIFQVKNSLKIEREVKINYFMWNSQSALNPTQIGLRLNQKILEKTSPFNFFKIDCEEDEICFSFYIYQNFKILFSSEKQIFQNKLFDEIRECQIYEDHQLSQNQDQFQKLAQFQKQQKVNQKLSKFFESENCESKKKSLSINHQDSTFNNANIKICSNFSKSTFDEKEIDEKLDKKDFQIQVFNSKNAN